MKREIFEVVAKVVDSNGTFNALTGYPKTFDSRSYSNDVAKAQQRAIGEWHNALGAMSTADTRQCQVAFVYRVSDGLVLGCEHIGAIADMPDPEEEESNE